MTIEDAIILATEAHRGQVDKAGKPYILHPLRLMSKMATHEERLAALLHDVVEDTPWTLEQLEAKGLAGDALEAVRLVTKLEGVDYKDEANLGSYLEQIKRHPVARRVKLADLEDKLNLIRLDVVTDKDCSRLNRYLMARTILESNGRVSNREWPLPA